MTTRDNGSAAAVVADAPKTRAFRFDGPFHGRTAVVRVRADRVNPTVVEFGRPGLLLTLTARQFRTANRKLCGSSDCPCGDTVGYGIPDGYPDDHTSPRFQVTAVTSQEV